MQVSNAIAWGHMQLKGGWRNILLVSAAYFAIIGGLILVTIRLDPTAVSQALSGWTMGLMGLQIMTLLMFGCWAISAAVRKDVTTKMIESHRLMPVSGTDAVAGYVIGPACQAIALSVVNLLLGLAISAWGSFVSPMGWLKANCVLGVFAACSWVVVVFLPLVMPVGSRVLLGLICVLAMAHQGLVPVLPGLSILFGPAMNDSVFGIVVSGRISAGYQISMLAQVLVAVLCYIGAARKYRRDDVLAWGPIMGLVALGAYVALSLTGLSLWEVISPRMLRIERIPFEVQLLVAGVGALCAGILPVSAAAWLHTLYERRRALHDPAPNPRPVAVGLVVVTAAVIAAGLLPLAVRLRWNIATLAIVQASQMHVSRPAVGPIIPLDTLIRTLLIALAFLLSMSYLLRVVYRRAARSGWIVALFMALTWAGPPFVDYIVNGVMTSFRSDNIITEISGCSPPVALTSLWASSGSAGSGSTAGNPLGSTNLGIAVQLLITAGLAVLYHRAKRPAPAAAVPAAG